MKFFLFSTVAFLVFALGAIDTNTTLNQSGHVYASIQMGR